MEKTYDEWLQKQNRRWKGKRYRTHLSAADIDRLVKKSITWLADHGH